MSNKERVMQLIEDVPDTKLIFVVQILESMRAYAGEEVIPDEYDIQLIEQAEAENDGETITFDEMCKELGVVL